jgi:hypothetical protein
VNNQNTPRVAGESEVGGGVVPAPTASEHTPDALEAPAGEHAVSKIILVVDDELHQFTKSHVNRWASSFYDTIADVNDPVFDNLWEVAKSVSGLGAEAWEVSEAAAYLASEVAVSNVLLSPKFEQIAKEPLRALLATFHERARWAAELKSVFHGAFHAPEFELQFVPAPRPAFARVGQCAAVFLDLFLERGESSPVAAVQSYLGRLAADAGDAILPPIILMSSHSELEENKRRFSEHARISAAGLMVLPKATLMEPEFRVSGLLLAFKQLDRQKHVAHALRRFMASWLQALETAKENTARTLWNLDASAMQQIHFASISDDDPYDEHLSEFLSREHLFHVEAHRTVGASLAELDKQFRAQLNADGQISNRLMSPLADVKTARAFVSHFTWFGSAVPGSFIDGEGGETGAAARISRLLPFGSVLVQEQIGDGSRCLIHITQQCDLNAISRSKDSSRTLVFAAAVANELQASSNPIVKSTELVAKSLQIRDGTDEREFDLRVNVGELLAMPLCEFLTRARTDGWRVAGRLRSDITTHVVAATTSQMSRPASQKMIRPGLLKSKVFLQSEKLDGAKIALIDKGLTAVEGQPIAKTFSLLRYDSRYSLEDNASIEIALWLAYHSAAIGLALDADLLSGALRLGWTSAGELPGGLRVRVRECESLQNAFRGLARGDVSQGSAQLTLVVER